MALAAWAISGASSRGRDRGSGLDDAHPCPVGVISIHEVHLDHAGVRQTVRELARRRIVASEATVDEYPLLGIGEMES